MHHVGARLDEERRELVLGLGVGLGHIDVAPQRALREQPRLGLVIVTARVDAFGVGRPALLDARYGQPRRQDGDAQLAAFGERAGRDYAAPQRRPRLLHGLGPQRRDVDLVELAVVGERRFAPRPLDDVDRLRHALAAVVAAQPVAHEFILVVDRTLADADIDAALAEI